MKKILPVAIVLLIGLGIFFFATMKSQGPSSKITAQPTSASKMENISGTLNDLLARNISTQCTFESTTEFGTSSGSVYVAGKKMRGDFKTKQKDGKEMQSYMIRDNDYIYTWSNLQKEGSKIKIVDMDKQIEEMKKNPSFQGSQNAVSLENQNANYNCKPWNKDESMFSVPTNIKFIDLTEQMEKIQNVSKDLKQTQCAACEKLPEGQSRDQCLTSLGCK